MPNQACQHHDELYGWMSQVDRRVDETKTAILAEMGNLRESVVRQIALCEPCRRIVMGNGSNSIDRRVTVLETARTIKNWILGPLLGAAATGAIGMVVVLLRWWLRLGP